MTIEDLASDSLGNTDTPFYLPVADEVEVFRAAHERRLAVMLKGPTGCGKTRFVEAMAHCLGLELVSVACHEDLTAADLVGRHLLEGGSTVWADGPLTRAVRTGAICYLDEIVEARQDTTVVIHPLGDHRRQLTLDRLNLTLEAADGFTLVMSYNPGYQSVLKDLKDSTRQRTVAVELGYPPPEVEARIVAHETELSDDLVDMLVGVGQAIRGLDTAGLREVASTRALIAAGHLISAGIPSRRAVHAAIVLPLTDDHALVAGLAELIESFVPPA